MPFTVASGDTYIHPANFLAGREIDREYIGEKLLDRQRIDSSFLSILEICLQAAVLLHEGSGGSKGKKVVMLWTFPQTGKILKSGFL